MASPKITVVIPVYNRENELRRALTSIQNQTLTDFECIVVDDASTVPIKHIVKEFNDPRFIYEKNRINGGPYNARTCGYRMMRGQYLFHLDSDWEAFPWALAQAVKYLDEIPEVDAVAGLHLRNHDSRLFVRVTQNMKIVTPNDYLCMPKVPDCVGTVRRRIVSEWLKKRRDYFALESHQWFTFGLEHNQLYVDEPWTKYYTDSVNRVTGTASTDRRRLDDYMKFLEEHKAYIETVNCDSLNHILFSGWRHLKNTGRTKDAKLFEHYLKLKNIDYKKILRARLARQFSNRILRRLRLRDQDSVYYV